MINDSQTGYCLRVVKSEESKDKLIVSNLEELNLSDIDIFFCDNYHTSIPLSLYLKEKHNIGITATMKNRRKYLPDLKGL